MVKWKYKRLRVSDAKLDNVQVTRLITANNTQSLRFIRKTSFKYVWMCYKMFYKWKLSASQNLPHSKSSKLNLQWNKRKFMKIYSID